MCKRGGKGAGEFAGLPHAARMEAVGAADRLEVGAFQPRAENAGFAVARLLRREDRPPGIVVANDDLHRQSLLHQGHGLLPRHQEPAVADKDHDRRTGPCERGADAARHAVTHRARHRPRLRARSAEPEIAMHPARESAAVGDDDRIRRQLAARLGSHFRQIDAAMDGNTARF